MLPIRATDKMLDWRGSRINKPGEDMSARIGGLLHIAIAAAVVLPAISFAQAQTYPTRPVRVLTTTSAGGISDIFMRALGDELQKRWGQAFVIENRPGG